ncbi:MAG: EcsC protein family [Rhodobacteraceae bacterium HLUCCA08]|nr:MAG: EcsC protein family [Rhodobacteraceae bacterium HLUCCA08]
MTATDPPMREVNPAQPLPPLDDAARAVVAALARRQNRAQSVLMQIVTFVGAQVEDGLKLLPGGTRRQIEEAARRALSQSYDLAGRSRGGLGARITGDRAHRVLGTISGALGGLGGLPTALAELPVATTFIFRAVQGVAAQHGEDPTSPETRAECLAVFGAGGPGDGDDGIDTAFLGARLSLTGPALNKLIAKVAPKFAAVLSQKLATQAVPVLGAAAGAGTNYAFIDYYVEIAHVHFGLRALARTHGPDAVADAFHAELARLKRPVTRA